MHEAQHQKIKKNIKMRFPLKVICLTCHSIMHTGSVRGQYAILNIFQRAKASGELSQSVVFVAFCSLNLKSTLKPR